MKLIRNPKGNQKGLTLTEIIIAMAIFGLVGSGVMFALNVSSKTILSAHEITTAESLTRTMIEYVKRTPYDSDIIADELQGSLSDDPAITTITLDDADEFPTSGIIQIEEELVQYDGKSGDSLENCVRGYAGTTAASHDAGKAVINSPPYYDDATYSDIFDAAGIDFTGDPYYGDYSAEIGVLRLDPEADDYDDDDGMQKIMVLIRYQGRAALTTAEYKVNR